MTFYNPTKLFSAPEGLKPDVIVLPLRNEQACYGPYHNGPIKQRMTKMKTSGWKSKIWAVK